MSTSVGSIHYDLSLDTKKFDNAVSGVGAKLSKIGSSAEKVATGFMVAGAAIAFAGKKALDSASDYQQARIAFDTMLGSAEKGQKMMKELSEFAKKTPFDLPQVVEGAKSLLAYGISADKIIPSFNALGNIAAGVGRDKLPQLTLAFGQVRTAGKLTGMELRQFTEAGVPLLDALAAQSGKTASQVKADMESGIAPSFEEVEKALFSMSENGGKFYNLMEKQSQTFAGRMSNIGDSVGQIIRGMLGIDVEGNVTPGSIFDKVSNAAEKLMTFLENNKQRITDSIQSIFSFIEEHGDKIAVFVGVTLVSAFTSLAVSVISTTWPILLLAGLITGLYMLYERFKPQIDGFINKVVTGFQILYGFFSAYILPVFQTIWHFISVLFVDAWNRLKQAIEPNIGLIKTFGMIIGGVLIVIISAAVIGFLLVVTTIGLVIAFLAQLISWVGALINWFINLSGTINSFTKNIGSWLVGAGKSLIQGLVNGITSMASLIWSGMSTTLDGIGRFVSGIGSWLVNAGKSLIQGLVNGITSMASAPANAVKGVLDKARNLLPFSPAKEGPFSGKGWTLYSGKSIMEGLATGINDNARLPSEALYNALANSSINVNQSPPNSSTINNSINGIVINSPSNADYLLRRLGMDDEAYQIGLVPGGAI